MVKKIYKIHEKGRLSIPVNILEKTGLSPGDYISFSIKQEGNICIKKVMVTT